MDDGALFWTALRIGCVAGAMKAGTGVETDKRHWLEKGKKKENDRG